MTNSIQEVINYARELVSDEEFMANFQIYSDLGSRKFESNDLTSSETEAYYLHRNRVMTQMDDAGFGDNTGEVIVWIWEYQKREKLDE